MLRPSLNLTDLMLHILKLKVCYYCRSEIGKISLDNVFRERESLNVGIVASINKASEAWGITCLRYEIRKY